MKKLLILSSILLLSPLNILFSQEAKLDFNYSFQGDYNPSQDDYSTNMKIDSVTDVSVYINKEKKSFTVTLSNDTILHHHIFNTKYEGDLIIFNTTNLFNEAVIMIEESRNSITMLHGWVDQTELVKMHYNSKYYWAKK